MDKKVITRFPPSPTGLLHIGGVRTALFNYFFTRKNKGKMVFRVEDTDKERSKKEYEEDIIESLKWVGIQYEEGPFRQSERNEIYKNYLKKLIDEGKAYISKETSEEEGARSEVIRFKNPNKKIVFSDLIRGEIEFDTTELKDFVIAKSLEEPLYHLAVVVDDFEMKVTHVIRGEDGISNTPRQILIQEAIGAPRPMYAHLPLVLAPDRSKLSKRKHGESVSLRFYRDKEYLPEAVINFLALLGWNPGTNEEIFTMEELIEKFDLTKVQKGGAVFNIEKLNWINKEHLKRIPDIQKEVSRRLIKVVPGMNENIAEKIAPIVFDRMEVWSDIKKMAEEGELDYFWKEPAYEIPKLCWKTENPESTKKYLTQALSLLEKVDEKNFTEENTKNALWPYANEVGKGSVLWPMRFALSGRDKSPDPFALASILGKTETLKRIQTALGKL